MSNTHATATPAETRNANLADLAEMLTLQQETKLDAVVPAEAIRSVNGNLHIGGLSVEAQAGLVSDVPGVFRPTAIMDGQIADKLGVPVKYLRRLRDERIDLYDANVNGWLQGVGDKLVDGPDGMVHYEPSVPDPRLFMVRTFTNPDLGGEGVGRALLSDTYKPIDNLDVLTATLTGIRESGADVEIVSTNLTETRMTVDVAAPGLAVLAPKLLEGYRSPSAGGPSDRAREVAAREGQGYPAGEEPVVFAGFRLTNSETGGGAFSITPRVVVRVCKNGLTMTQDVLRMVHLGAKLDQGQVRFSDRTMVANLELVTSMATDAVTTFLDVDYVQMVVDQLTAKATKEIGDPVKVVEIVAQQLRFTEATTAGILSHFIKGGQATAGGVMQAVTSYAQDDSVSADLAYDLENVAVKALEIAYLRSLTPSPGRATYRAVPGGASTITRPVSTVGWWC